MYKMTDCCRDWLIGGQLPNVILIAIHVLNTTLNIENNDMLKINTIILLNI